MRPIRVLVTDSGTDGPARSAADAVARLLRDAGMEVVRTRDGSAPAVARAAVQEDAAAVHLAGDDGGLAAAVRALLAAEGAGEVLVVGPGTPADVAAAIAGRAG